MSRFHKVAQITERVLKCSEVAGKRIARFNVGGQIYAIDGICTHEAARAERRGGGGRGGRVVAWFERHLPVPVAGET